MKERKDFDTLKEYLAYREGIIEGLDRAGKILKRKDI